MLAENLTKGQSSSEGLPLFLPCTTSVDGDKSKSVSSELVIRRTTSWKWVIVFGSFCVHFVADGVLFSFGLLMHLIKDDLKIELHTVGIIASLFVSLPLFLSPLSGALVNKFGCRVVTMSGGVLCSLGLLVASTMGNYLGAFIGIGLMCGVGLSCVYVPAVVIVAHYFDENRAIATAIAVGGTGLGNALVAQLIHQLNNYYDDWRDTTFFLSGIFFTIVGFGALFRPVEFFFSPKDQRSSHSKIPDSRLPPSCMTSMEKLHRFIDAMDQQCASREAKQSTSLSNSHPDGYEGELFDSYSEGDLKELEDEFNENPTDRERVPLTKFRLLLKSHSVHEGSPTIHRFLSLSPENQEKQLLKVYYQPLSQKDIFYPGNVPLKSSNQSQINCPDLIQSYVYEESIASISEEESNTLHPHRRLLFYRKGLSFVHTLRRMLGLQLFRDYRYAIFFLSQFLFYLFYDLIYLFPVDYGERVMGYTKQQTTMLVTILGLGQFFGQIFFGLVANYTSINELILYDFGTIFCGIASVLIPFVAQSYLNLLLTILLFGLSISANYALTSIILADMCGLELLTSAYGLILLGQGLSSLAGPVVGGWIAERYGYQSSLILAGIAMGLSGSVILLIPLLSRFRSKKNKHLLNIPSSIATKTTTIQSDTFR